MTTDETVYTTRTSRREGRYHLEGCRFAENGHPKQRGPLDDDGWTLANCCHPDKPDPYDGGSASKPDFSHFEAAKAASVDAMRPGPDDDRETVTVASDLHGRRVYHTDAACSALSVAADIDEFVREELDDDGWRECKVCAAGGVNEAVADGGERQ